MAAQYDQWQFRFVDTTTIEAGEFIAPARLSSDLGREYAEWHMVGTDLSFALDCLKEADKLGIPDSENLHSKALIFSAVVAYARPFKTSVRALRMDAAHFSASTRLARKGTITSLQFAISTWPTQ
jgi:hypothetical protein